MEVKNPDKQYYMKDVIEQQQRLEKERWSKLTYTQKKREIQELMDIVNEYPLDDYPGYRD